MKLNKMNMPFKKSKKIIFLILTTLFGITSCQSQSEYDPELMTPDHDPAGLNHGVTLTALGCFLYYPWEYRKVRFDSLEAKKVYSNKTVNEIKENLVFEPQRDGTMKYWFKWDYLVSPIDTVVLADGNKSIEITRQKSKDLKIKKIYSGGKWEANFKDSTIAIDFGENNFGLNPIKGKYYLLTAEFLYIFENVEKEFYINSEKKWVLKKPYHQFAHYKW